RGARAGEPDQREPRSLGVGEADRRAAAGGDRRARDVHLGLRLPGRIMSLIDVQALPDTRGVGLDEVGVEGLRYPVLVCDGQRNKRDTVATMTMSVDVAREVKGAHLSRFVEVLHAWRDQLSAASLVLMTDDLRRRMR